MQKKYFLKLFLIKASMTSDRVCRQFSRTIAVHVEHLLKQDSLIDFDCSGF